LNILLLLLFFVINFLSPLSPSLSPLIPHRYATFFLFMTYTPHDLVQAVAAVPEDRPSAHSWQVEEPGRSEYIPGGQAKQKEEVKE
jgi:hypothetical protein